MTTEMMGVDIKTTNDDINFNVNNDLILSTISNNLSQAIINRLKTPRGFYSKHPEYGSYLYRVLGKPNIDATKLYARQVIYEALLQEPRVDSVEQIIITYTTETIMNIFIQVIAIDDVNPYNIVFDYFLQ